MQEIRKEILEGERALFRGCDLQIEECTFRNGESPLKESKNIEITNSTFAYKYPLWYASDVTVADSTWEEMGRAGVWYTKNISISNCKIDAPKNFRRCENVAITDTTFSLAEETLWNNNKVTLKNVTAKGDYFAMGCNDVEVDNITLDGNYGFDGIRNLHVKNSKLYTKDAFWNCENVLVENSYVEGEYFAWNSKNVTLIDCEIDSLQGLCYIENLKLINCKLTNTNLAFEYCKDIDAEIVGGVKSILNPTSGVIKADHIGTVTEQDKYVNPEDTKIICENIDAFTDEPDFEEY